MLFVAEGHTLPCTKHEIKLGGHSNRYFNKIKGMEQPADSGAAIGLSIAILPENEDHSGSPVRTRPKIG